MKMKYLIDTDILIDIFRGVRGSKEFILDLEQGRIMRNPDKHHGNNEREGECERSERK
ncbi:MAG: hypothetical protein OCU16_04650 [Candidatus Methanospirare jalkutatii]|nr:hypothetical protein [Candidatus Methanospirare jalkutatii]